VKVPLRPELEVAALSGEVDAVMQGIVERLMTLPHADGASLSSTNGESATFRVCVGEDLPLLGQTYRIDDTLAGEVMEHRDVVLVREGPHLDRSLTKGARSIALVPLEWDGEVRGVLGVRSSAPGAFDENGVEEIRTLAAGASIAIRNAELLERLAESERDLSQRKENEDRLRTSLGRLHAIVQTQQEISALELEPHTVTSAIVERAQRLAGGDGAAVQWFEEHDSVFHFCAGTAANEVGLRMERSKSLAGVAALAGEPVYSPDTSTDPRVDANACIRLGARSLICAPLYREGRIQGVLSVMSQRPDAFDELAIETTRLMAEFVSTVMRNAAELETRRQLVEQLRTQGQVVQHMQTALWVWSVEGDEMRLEYANAASRDALGLDPDEIIGLTIEELLPALSPETKAGLLQVVIDGVPSDRGEIEYGDHRIPHSILSCKVFPLAGNRLAVTFENVTDRVQAQRALQDSEARFRGAFEGTSVGMAFSAVSGVFEQVNEHLGVMLGYTPEELLEIGPRGITHTDEFEVDTAAAARLRAGELETYDRVKRYIRKDGSIMWGHLSLAPVRDNDGNLTTLVSHVLDVTKEKEADLLFESTFKRSVVPMIVIDDDRRLVDANQAASDLLGLAYDDALGQRIDDFLADDPVEEAWPRFVAAGRMESEAWLHLPDGRRRRVEYVATANVQPGRHIAVIRDLTRQKELESQLSQAQKMEAVGRLAGGIAHDFNNLLTAISGYAEFLISGEQDERLRRHAEEIKKAGNRAAALTGQLLAFSRRQVLQPRVLDLNAVVSDMDMMLRRLIGEDVELVAMLEPDLASVRADPTQIEQVIVNLAVNARDAMPHGGSVTIETQNLVTDTESFVELRLTDTGIGMTETERQHLFDPFFTTKEGGTGLGLATVYGVVEQSGGTIEVESAPGLGSSFRILLPAVPDEAEVWETAPQSTTPTRGVESVLLVEDEGVVRQLVAQILEAAGYSVLQAGDGPSALELLRRHSGEIHLLVTDVVMPGMSGPEVAKAITAMRPGTQVLYISGYTDSQVGHHGVLEPGIAFLQKPFSANDLQRKVRNLLDGAVPVD
jgi:PAS domain S-box-containing protein